MLISKSEKHAMECFQKRCNKRGGHKKKIFEWESVKIINKQVMYKELGSAAPQIFISLSGFHDNSTPEAHCHWVIFQESTYRCALR